MKKQDLKHGMQVTCSINSVFISDAKISIDQYGDCFICQNVRDGSVCNNTLGYKYAWIITFNTNYQVMPDLMCNLKAVKIEKEPTSETKQLPIPRKVILNSGEETYLIAGIYAIDEIYYTLVTAETVIAYESKFYYDCFIVPSSEFKEIPEPTLNPFQEMINIINDDSIAMSYQSLTDYRSALINLCSELEEKVTKETKALCEELIKLNDK